MILFFQILFGLSLFGIAQTYIFYPLFLFFLESIKNKKNTTKRESDAKSRAKADKPKRARKAAAAAKKPVSATADALTQQYHLTDPEKTGFLHKTRSITPTYVSNSWKEVRMVTWPGRKETWRLVFAVFMFAIVMGTSIAVLDYGLEKVMRQIIL
mgnify:CR=1 FL=1